MKAEVTIKLSHTEYETLIAVLRMTANILPPNTFEQILRMQGRPLKENASPGAWQRMMAEELVRKL